MDGLEFRSAVGAVSEPASQRRMRVLAFAIAWLALGSGCASETRFAAPGDHEVRIEHDGLDRSAIVHLPPDFRARGPLPVVLSFHGGGGNAAAHEQWTAMEPLADREGFVLVYPNGTGRLRRWLLTWNAGSCCGPARRENVDDVGFVLALLADLARDLPLDPTRVYATGMSNGAMMSYRLAVEAPGRIAAIAPVAGAMVYEGRLFDAGAPPGPAMPVIHFHSVDDPRALYEGGLGPPFPMTNHRVMHPPVEEKLRLWIRYDGCPATPEVGETVRDDGQTATRLVWGPCRDGSEVVLVRLTGAGHVWPGAHAHRPRLERLLGPPTDVVDANEEIWRFFERFRRPDAPPLAAR